MIPFFVPEFTKDMENAAIDALRNEKFVIFRKRSPTTIFD